MPRTEVRSAQIRDATVGRSDVNIATPGEAIVTKIVAGTGVSLSYTGADGGTGDVTITATGGAGGAHAPSHSSIGADPVTITTLAGYPGDGSLFLNGMGSFVIPAGGGGSGLILPLVQDPTALQIIRQTTVDGADNSNIVIQGGGAHLADRGSSISVNGNESANLGGILCRLGNVTGATFRVLNGGTSGTVFDVNPFGDVIAQGAYTFSTVDGTIRQNTADGADTGYVQMCGGGGVPATRGARILATGNEYGAPGSVFVDLGAVGGSGFFVRDTAEASILTVNTTGVTVGSSFTGGNVALKTVNNNFVAQTLASFSNIYGVNGCLTYTDTLSPLDLKVWRHLGYGDGAFRLESLNDAATVVTQTFTFGRNGVFYSPGLQVAGAANITGLLTLGNSIKFGTLLDITASTTDGADNGRVLLCSGGGISPDRGPMIQLYANEYGGGIGGNMYLDAKGVISFRNESYSTTLSITNTGEVNITSGLTINGVALQPILRFGGGTADHPAFRWQAGVLELVNATNTAHLHFIASKITTYFAGNNFYDLTCGLTNFTAGVNCTGGNIVAGTGTISCYGAIYPGRYDAPGGIQTSWFLTSHSSYGLYTTTGFYCANLWSTGILSVGTNATIGTTLSVTGYTYLGSHVYLTTNSYILRNVDTGYLTLCGGSNAVGANGAYVLIAGTGYDGSIGFNLGSAGGAAWRFYHGNGTLIMAIDQLGKITQGSYDGATHAIWNAANAAYQYMVFQRSGANYGFVGNAGVLGGGGLSAGDDFCVRGAARLILASDINNIIAMPIYNVGYSGAGVGNVWIESNGLIGRATSSRRYKTNIQSYDGDAALKLRPVSFNPKDKLDMNCIGLIAEEVAEIDPRFAYNGIDGQPDGLMVGAIIASMLAAMRGMDERLRKMEGRVH